MAFRGARCVSSLMVQRTNMPRPQAAAMTFALLGAAVAAYLSVEYLTGQAGLCLTDSGCDAVRASAFAYPLGVPLPLFGVAFFLAAGWLVWRSLDQRSLLGVSPASALLGWATLGLVASVILTIVEIAVIRALCTWCLASAVAAAALFVASGQLWRRCGSPEEILHSTRARREVVRREADVRRALARLTVTIGVAMSVGAAALLVAGAVLVGQAPSTAESDVLAPAASPRRGSGPVEVVAFSDFQCPACAATEPLLDQLISEGRITLVYRHFPLTSIHANAEPAARAAVAAGEASMFWEMHDRLFASQAEWSNLDVAGASAYFERLARDLRLDIGRFRADLDAAESIVSRDAQAALALNLRGTPSLFIAGQPYSGPLTADGLRAAVDAAP